MQQPILLYCFYGSSLGDNKMAEVDAVTCASIHYFKNYIKQLLEKLMNL